MSVAPQRPRPVVPAVASSFLGRAAELAALAELTEGGRLVTVVGLGGCGRIYLVTNVDGAWVSLRTMDMDHDNINRFWDAVGMPPVRQLAP